MALWESTERLGQAAFNISAPLRACQHVLLNQASLCNESEEKATFLQLSTLNMLEQWVGL